MFINNMYLNVCMSLSLPTSASLSKYTYVKKKRDAYIYII